MYTNNILTVTAAVLHTDFPTLFSRGISFFLHVQLSVDTGHIHRVQGDVTQLGGPAQPEHTLGQLWSKRVQVTNRVR